MKPVPLEVTMMKIIGELKAENARLKAEVERLSKPAIIGKYNLSQYIRMANSETLEFDNGDIFADMTLPERIKYIVESHARLKAEVERLEHQVNYWRIEAEVDNARWLRCLQDLEELRASSFVTAVPAHQYERIVKAGDAMASSIQFNEEMSQDYNGPTIVHQSVQRWNAAKEGKGQP